LRSPSKKFCHFLPTPTDIKTIFLNGITIVYLPNDISRYIKMFRIDSHTGLQEKVRTNKTVWLLLYKKGFPLSECSFTHYRTAVEMLDDGGFCYADLNQVRDIHAVYGITSVPALLQFKEGKMVNITKGCQDPRTYKAIFENAIYATSSKSKEPPERRVVVYTAPGCTWCSAVKRHLETHRIRYHEVDVTKNPEAAREMIARSGKQGVPQMDINGRMVVGFDRTEINRLTGMK
jgi:glutaredoxin-like YruB-family protein